MFYRFISRSGLLFCLAAFTPLLFAQSPTPITDTPFIKAIVDGVQVDNLPLLLTTVDASISGIIADVTVTQHYKNDGERPVEAIYVFPGSTDAAVYAFEMQVNDRLVIAEINEKNQARAIYEEAKEAGKTTSLLEQTDNAFFQTNVGNILPGDDIRVTLRYVETLIPDRGQYTFSFPIIRQTSEGASLPEGIAGTSRISPTNQIGFDMLIELHAGMPIAEIASPTHQIETDHPSAYSAYIALNEDDLFNNDKDFILRYRLAGDAIQTGLLSYQGQDENYFLLMAQPPQHVTGDEIPPREYLFVVDVSGSMQGLPIDIAKRATSDMLLQLRDIDLFNVYTFAGGNEQLATQSVRASAANVDAALEMVNASNPMGGTNLHPVLLKISNTPVQPGISRSVIVLTDGGINAGTETLQLVRENLHFQNLFAVGIGNFRNQYIVEGLAHSGRGQAFVADNPMQADILVDKLIQYISQPVLTDISVNFPDGIEVYDVIPHNIPDVFSERPVYLVGKWQGAWNGPLTINGIAGDREYSAEYMPAFTGDNAKLSAIRLLWAREQLRDWEVDQQFGDYQLQQDITRLGLDYSLVTPYTSFVAVDYEVRRDPETQAETVALANAPPGSLSRQPMRGVGMAASSLSGRLAMDTPIKPVDSLLTMEKVALPPASTSDSLSDVTFIMGSDEADDNQFYAAATAYFGHHADEQNAQVVTHLRSLSEVRTWLANNGGTGVWHKINIVAHGSAWTGLGIPVTPGESNADMFPLELVGDFDNALDDHLINAQSEIRLYGCGLGASPRLLNQLAQYFGGDDPQRPVIYSPSEPIEFYAEINDSNIWSVGYTLHQSWSLVGSSRSPWSVHKLIRELQSEYGASQQWEELLKDQHTHFTTDPISFVIAVPGLDYAPEGIPAWQLAKRQPLLIRYLNETGMDIRDLDWQFEKEDHQVRIVGTGWLYRISKPAEIGDHPDQFVMVKPPASIPTTRWVMH